MNIKELHRLFEQSSGAVTDSRKVKKDCLFFALRGENFNGNDFAEEALSKGASYAIVDNESVASGRQHILVKNVLEVLQQLATYHRKLFHIPVIGITGSNGKTTTKELVRDVLASSYNVIATPGNLNNHIGVPLSVLEIRAETEFAVIEMGANHVGEIRILCEIADPTHGMITNIGKAHIEGFGTIEGVIRAKSELYDHIRNRNGHVFVSNNQDILMELSQNIERTVYGSGDRSLVSGRLIPPGPLVHAEISYPGGEREIRSHLFGKYNLQNILAAWCIGLHFSVDPDRIAGVIEDYQPSNLRSQVVDTGRNLLIMDTYNANPASMGLALADFSALEAPRKLLIIGDMLELGETEEEEHRKILERVNSMKVDQVIVIGPVFDKLAGNTPYHRFNQVEQAMSWLENQGMEGYTVFIKGSRKIGLEKVLPLL